MTISRLFPIQIRAAVEALLAPVVLVTPIVLGFPGPALLAALALGVLLMGSALQATGRNPRVSVQINLNIGITILASICAISLALIGEPIAALLFTLVAIAETLLGATTRYSSPSSTASR